jgi:hypothetical protein
MRSTRTRSLPIALLMAAIALLVSVASAGAAPIPAGGVAIDHASLDWTGNTLMQGKSESFVGVNYFSAGTSAGTEATYSAQNGNVAIYNVNAAGTETLATWATRTEHTEAGSKQVVRLADGVGRIEADGSATVKWTGSFSENFYGGLVPFTLTDPVLTIAADGSGALTGTIVGCKAGMGGGPCEALAPATVTIADFAGVHANPEEVLTVKPAYAGVEVDTTGGPAQNRSVEGWGAWPQSFVSYQIQTGLSSYWYSSGSVTNDPKKPPLPFSVDFKGKIPPVVTPPGETPPATTPITTSTPTVGKAKIGGLKGTRTIGPGGIVKLAGLVCPSGGTTCKTVVPKHVGARIGGERYLIGVMAPKTIGAGKSAAVRARLPKAAREALGDGKLTIALPVALKANGKVVKQTLEVKIGGKR